jgi:hypothetical protein
MFGNLIPAKTILGLVKGEIEKALSMEIKRFDMVYKAVERAVDFNVYIENKKRVYPYKDEGGALVGGIEMYLHANIQTGDKIDYAIVKYYGEDKPSMLEIYLTTSTGEKTTTTKAI